MGYKLAGFDVIAANDIDPEMAWHYKRNLNPKHYFLCSIRDLLTADLPDELFQLDILDGSPPCSTFSMSGSREDAWGKEKHFREGQAKQVLSDLFFDYLDLVERLKPRVAIAENVKGMILGNAKGYARLVIQRFREMGYRPQLFLINAADCGVPQRRERVFFCAVRDDCSALSLNLAMTNRWRSCIEAVGDLQRLTKDEDIETQLNQTSMKWWPLTRPNEDFGQAVMRHGQPEKFWNHKKLSADMPSRALSARDNFYHWSEPRRLTYREWKRLGSFPDDYYAKSDKIGKYMIGMSVPPLMTKAVAEAVRDQWFAKS